MPHIGTFPWAGGKSKKLSWLLPQLNIPNIDIFVDAFGGSGVVGLNLQQYVPLRVYNDLDEDIYNFFVQLRRNPDELIRQLYLTPYSLQESKDALNITKDMDAIEKARRFFVSISFSYRGNQKTWGYTQSAEDNIQVTTNRKRVERLNIIANELAKGFEFHNQSAVDLVKKFGRNDKTLIYLDPPYMPGTWNEKSAKYKYVMSAEQHEQLLKVALEAESRVAVSGYASNLYDEMLIDWRRSTKKVNVSVGAVKNKSYATEVLWMNYEPDGMHLRKESEMLGLQSDMFTRASSNL